MAKNPAGIHPKRGFLLDEKDVQQNNSYQAGLPQINVLIIRGRYLP